MCADYQPVGHTISDMVGGIQGSHYCYYVYWQQADYIISNGHFSEIRSWHVWPLHNLLISSLVAILGTSKPTAIPLCLALLFLTPLYLTSVYGSPDYPSRSYLSGAYFFNEQASRGSLFSYPIHMTTIKYHPQL